MFLTIASIAIFILSSNAVDLTRFEIEIDKSINPAVKPELYLGPAYQNGQITPQISAWHSQATCCMKCFQDPDCGTASLDSNDICLKFAHNVTLGDTIHSTNTSLFSRKMLLCMDGQFFIEGNRTCSPKRTNKEGCSGEFKDECMFGGICVSNICWCPSTE